MKQDNLPDTAEFSSQEQRARSFFGFPPQKLLVQVGAVSDRGKVRSNNEDHYAVVRRSRSGTILATNMPEETLPRTEEEAYLLVVADGIGGEAFGEVASMLALRTAWALAERETCWTLNMNEAQAGELAEKFDAYAQLIHQKLMDHVQAEPKTAGMGTTLTVAYTVGATVFIGHVGDSRAYLLRDGKSHLLTRDQTLAQELVDAGMEPAEASKFGHVLTNFLGGRNHQVVTETRHLQLRHRDSLLLCTDGLTKHVRDEEIAEVIERATDPQQACQSLLDRAMQRGGKDNITIIAARYEFPMETARKD